MTVVDCWMSFFSSAVTEVGTRLKTTLHGSTPGGNILTEGGWLQSSCGFSIYACAPTNHVTQTPAIFVFKRHCVLFIRLVPSHIPLRKLDPPSYFYEIPRGYELNNQSHILNHHQIPLSPTGWLLYRCLLVSPSAFGRVIAQKNLGYGYDKWWLYKRKWQYEGLNQLNPR